MTDSGRPGRSHSGSQRETRSTNASGAGAAPSSASRLTSWLGRGRAVLLGLAGAALVLASGLPVWVTARVADAAGSSSQRVTGTAAVDALVPVALAAGAGAFALTLVDGWARRLVALVVAVCGLGLAVLVGVFLMDPAAALHAPGMVVTAATATLAPWPALLGSLVLTAVGIGALVAGERWPHRAPRRAGDTGVDRRRSDWDALSEGDDPT